MTRKTRRERQRKVRVEHMGIDSDGDPVYHQSPLTKPSLRARKAKRRARRKAGRCS